MSPLKKSSIGVFDSGLGGLTVMKEISRLLPSENLIYVGDTARVPYGTKSPRTIQRYALQIGRFLLKKKVKAIVVACNSASSVALTMLKKLPVPVIGVLEPGAHAAAAATKKMRIGVIGTPATIGSHAYKKAIQKIRKNSKVWEQSCPLFVPLVEEGRLSDDIAKKIVNFYLRPLKQKNIDTLVLGCTHYPLLKKNIANTMGTGVTLIDSAQETAKTVRLVLSKKGSLNPARGKGERLFFTTDDPSLFRRMGHRFFGQTVSAVRHLPVERLEAN